MGQHQQALPHVNPEPCVIFGTGESPSQPSVRAILPAVGNNGNVRQAVDSRENGAFYGMAAQYNGFQHHHPARTMTAPNYYDPFMTSGARPLLPLPLNQGPYNQMASSSNGGLIAVPTIDYSRNYHFVDGIGVPYKGKSVPYYNGSASSSSGIAPLSMRPMEARGSVMNASSLPLPDYRGSGMPAVMEGGTYRSMPNMSGAIGPDPGMAHSPFQLVQANNYQGQAFPAATSPWMDSQYGNNGGDGAPFTWSHAPAITYLPVNNVSGGGPQPVNMGAPGYHESAAGRSFPNFVHLPPPQANLGFHYPPPVQGVRGLNNNFHVQVPTAPQRISSDTSPQTIVNPVPVPVPENVEMGPRFVGPVPPTGLRIYQPHLSQRALVPDANMRHRNLPHLRFLPVEEVAMLDISGYYEIANSVDHHRDLRLDVDHMSYEELLALGEQIGSVTTGLSEEAIASHLKSRKYSPSNCTNVEDASGDQEADFCVVCQNDYKKEETVGSLDCGHEYHVDCVKRWLLIKNTCPICKSPALVPERNHQSTTTRVG